MTESELGHLDEEPQPEQSDVDTLRRIAIQHSFYESGLDALVRQSVVDYAGTLDAVCQLVENSDWFRLLRLIRFERLSLSEKALDILGNDNVAILNQFIDRYSYGLSRLIASATDIQLYGIKTWDAVRIIPQIQADDVTILFQLKIFLPDGRIHEILDAPGSLINLSRTILQRTKRSLDDVARLGITFSDRERDATARQIETLEAVVRDLAELRELFQAPVKTRDVEDA